MNRRKFVAATGATLASIGLAGCSSNDESTSGTGADSGSGGSSGGSGGSSGGDTTTDDEFDLSSVDGTLGDNISENVEVTGHRAFQTAENVGVTGVIENTSGQQLEFVEVEVTLNDGDTIIGEFVDTSDEEIDYLGAGKQWRFWLTFDDEQLGAETSYTLEAEAEVSDDAGDASGTTSEPSTETESSTTTSN